MATTSSDIAGLMERINARTQAAYATQAVLINATTVQYSAGVSAVQFHGQSVPQTASLQTEGNAITSTTVSLPAVSATYGSYPTLVQLGSLGYNGGNEAYTIQSISDRLAGAVANTVDEKVCNLFSSSFSANTYGSGSTCTLANFNTAVAKLRTTKFSGEMVAVLHPGQWATLQSSISGVAGSKKELVDMTGYVASFSGVDIFISPWVKDFVSGTSAFGAIYVKQAIGLALRDPVAEFVYQRNLTYNTHDFLADLQMSAVNVISGAGYLLPFSY